MRVYSEKIERAGTHLSLIEYLNLRCYKGKLLSNISGITIGVTPK